MCFLSHVGCNRTVCVVTVCNLSREHRCGDGRCVSKDWLCDGDHDCLDKSDELNCSCRSQGLLECRNGQCIPSAFRCDGEDDCKDGSDEEHCSREQSEASVWGGPDSVLWPPARCEPITLELCMNLPYNLTSYPNYLGHLSQRETSVSWESSLFPALVQTGCYQYLMFYACTLLVPKCDPVSLQRVPPCRSLCRNAKEKCESVLGIVGLQWPEDSDCSQFPEDGGNSTCLLPEDGVDECSPSHFKCRSGRCVLANKRCDGHLDCDDHSDEDNCGETNPPSCSVTCQTAAEYQVCADEWNHDLSKLTCNQLGLGTESPSPQEETDPGGPGVTAGGVALAVLAAERSERTRLRLCPHRPSVGSDRGSLLRGVRLCVPSLAGDLDFEL
ncbi:hypothetical protein GOODEAATRI_009321 [Goodea atripinnis]|uniref:FZ domain-containing protein n=1 Tax=Goodea atripinnis TaxID=208336 RepID=A0ABV0P2T6_9TELE